MKHHLSHHSISEPKITKVLGNDFYIDVLATGTETEDKAIGLYILAREVNTSRGGFNLCKWKKTTSRVRQYIQNCENCDGVADRNKDEMAAC